MSDDAILQEITALVEKEHRLRARRAAGEIDSTEDREALRAAEVELDRCWDLLRQRRAKREFGEDEQQADARPSAVVEHYLQ